MFLKINSLSTFHNRGAGFFPQPLLAAAQQPNPTCLESLKKTLRGRQVE